VFIINSNLHTEASYANQVIDAFNFLLAEAENQGARVLGLNLHPWLVGQPHRIKYVEQILAHISNHNAVWFGNPSSIAQAFNF
jgi:allantoinase